MTEMLKHLYLFTLEVAPLYVGTQYNPLPAHFTLVSRFWSEHSPEGVASVAKPLFDRATPVELIFAHDAIIGPNRTPVHLIENTAEIRQLHERLCAVLATVGVVYTSPQFIGPGHKPHVSKRDGDGFAPGYRQIARAAYLIEVEIKDQQHRRFVHKKFELKA